MCCLLVENYSNSRQVWSSRSFLQFLWGLWPNNSYNSQTQTGWPNQCTTPNKLTDRTNPLTDWPNNLVGGETQPSNWLADDKLIVTDWLWEKESLTGTNPWLAGHPEWCDPNPLNDWQTDSPIPSHWHNSQWLDHRHYAPWPAAPNPQCTIMPFATITHPQPALNLLPNTLTTHPCPRPASPVPTTLLPLPPEAQTQTTTYR